MSRPIIFAVMVLAGALAVAGQAPERAPGNESIRQEDLRADLFFLAGDAMSGRLTGTVENLAAADYIRSRFERAGLRPPAPAGSYFQSYDNNASNLVRRSDQWPFLQRGVPALGFMTGLHPDYHTVYDRPEKINYAKIEKIARLVHQASWDLANADVRPRNTAGSTR